MYVIKFLIEVDVVKNVDFVFIVKYFILISHTAEISKMKILDKLKQTLVKKL